MPPKTWKAWIGYQIFKFQKLKHRKVSQSGYDLSVFFWWKSVDLVDVPNCKKSLVGIYTEGFPPGFATELQGLSIQEFINRYLSRTNGIVAGNVNIFNLYKDKGLPIYYATGATDTDLFQYNRETREGTGLKVCWTGNPNRNFKGFYDFVEPAVKLAQQKYPDIELITRFKGPMATLPEFYRGVDIMVNASIGDAGPGFLIDAGACGVPAISTDVGFASELIKDHENGLISERKIEAIAAKIIEVYEDRSLLQKMSQAIAKDVHAGWGHASRAVYWDKMFDQVLGLGNE